MFTIGIAGGSGSGKTTLVNSILERVPYDQISLLTQDSYYKDSGHLPIEQRRALNFDHPDSIEWDLMLTDVQKLKSGQEIDSPTYSYLTCTRQPETIRIKPNLGNLKFAEGNYPTPYGKVYVKHVKQADGKINTTVHAPKEINVIK